MCASACSRGSFNESVVRVAKVKTIPMTCRHCRIPRIKTKQKKMLCSSERTMHVDPLAGGWRHQCAATW